MNLACEGYDMILAKTSSKHDNIHSNDVNHALNLSNNNELNAYKCILLFLGSKVDKPSKILVKTSSTMECIESNIQNTKVPRIDDPII